MIITILCLSHKQILSGRNLLLDDRKMVLLQSLYPHSCLNFVHIHAYFHSTFFINVVATCSNSKKRCWMKSKHQTFSYTEILNITDNFKTVIGEGGFGKVYMGILHDNTQVAVKMLSKSSKQGYKEFQSEVSH